MMVHLWTKRTVPESQVPTLVQPPMCTKYCLLLLETFRS